MTKKVSIKRTKTPEETMELGRAFGKDATPGSVLALSGELGSGKTCFTQGVAKGLGVDDHIKSPSFTILNIYDKGRLPFYHIDLYRVEADGELESLGLEEYIYGNGVCVIEWADRATSELPKNAVHIKFFYEDEVTRRITVEGVLQ